MYHARQKQWDPALARLRAACNLDPENRTYNNTLGYTLARMEQYDESVAVFTRLNGEAVAHYNVARMLHHLKQDGLSDQHAARALELNPDLATAQELLAELHGQPSAVAEEAYQEPVVTFAEAPEQTPVSN
jgi:tetratricopeptide (TPR) repeat protein